MVDGGFGAFGQAAFFETSREIRKQREEERATSVREGLAERQVAVQERRLGAEEQAAQVTALATTRETERTRIETLINTTAANLARASLEVDNIGDTAFSQNIMREIERMNGLATQSGLFGEGEVELSFRNAFDTARQGLLGQGEITGGNIQVTGTNVPGRRPGDTISQQEAQQLIASGQATAADFLEAPTRAEAGPPGGFLGGAAQERELINSAVQTGALIRNLNRAKGILEVDPASGQIAGDVALFANNMAANLDTLVREGVVERDTLGNATGGTLTLTDAQVQEDKARFASIFEGLAGSTSAFNAALIDAAYAKALIQNGTRPTEEDFRNAMRSLTGGAQNVTILLTNLDNAIDGIIDDHNTRVDLTTTDLAMRERFRVSLPSDDPQAQRASMQEREDQLRAEGKTDEEIEAILREEFDL